MVRMVRPTPRVVRVAWSARFAAHGACVARGVRAMPRMVRVVRAMPRMVRVVRAMPRVRAVPRVVRVVRARRFRGAN
jgi:hypothetical protein